MSQYYFADIDHPWREIDDRVIQYRQGLAGDLTEAPSQRRSIQIR